MPWGFNYDRDYKSRLLEDYWESEWPTVVEDFREMKLLGANVVRIHLQFARFMDATNQPNGKALERLARLARLAEDTGLYLDLTGLACYRKKDVPEWYARLSESERWAAQARFWEAVAGRCASSPAVFCYDLMNEPIVPSGKRNPGDWLTGELGGFVYCQFISLDQAGRPRPEIARKWVAELAAAIRKHDQRHLVTVGLLPSMETPESMSGFVPQKVAGPLDFVCVHVYPKSGHLNEDLELLHGFRAGKPVVVEEIFPMNCTAPGTRPIHSALEAGCCRVDWVLLGAGAGRAGEVNRYRLVHHASVAEVVPGTEPDSGYAPGSLSRAGQPHASGFTFRPVRRFDRVAP